MASCDARAVINVGGSVEVGGGRIGAAVDNIVNIDAHGGGHGS